MGCCNDKTLNSINKEGQMIVSGEEETIKRNEKLLKFTTLDTSDIIEQLKKYESYGILSKVLLKGALANLDFDNSCFTDPESPDFKFLLQLQNENKLFTLKTVCLSAILLGCGNTSEKAKLLFSLYDVPQKETLEKFEISAMLDDIINLAVNKIPLIAVDESEEPETNKFTLEKLQKHMNNLLDRKDRYLVKLQNRLLGGNNTVTFKEFISKFSDDPLLETILWSYQVRYSLLEQ